MTFLILTWMKMLWESKQKVNLSKKEKILIKKCKSNEWLNYVLLSLIDIFFNTKRYL